MSRTKFSSFPLKELSGSPVFTDKQWVRKVLMLLSCKWIGLELKFCNPSESEKRNFSCTWWYSVWQAKAGNSKYISIYYFLSCCRELLNKDRTEFFFFLNWVQKEVTMICGKL